MKRIYLTTISVITFLMCMIGCTSIGTFEGNLKIRNYSGEDIYIGCLTSASAVEYNENELFFEVYDNPSTVYTQLDDAYYSVKQTLDGMLYTRDLTLVFQPNQWLKVRIYKESTLQKYTREEIIENDIFDKEYYLNLYELERIHYLINYYGQ